MTPYSTGVTGWLFVIAAAMIWLGWSLTHTRIGTFFEPEDFARVRLHFRRWIWLFRFHLFGHIVAVMALVALGVLFSDTDARILVWPAVAVCSTGLLVGALAQAFYYHFGAWGALDNEGKTAGETKSFVSSLQVTTEYVTCLVRFGRVFFGLGQVVLAAGLWQSGLVPIWVTVGAALLGLAAMALTMGLPDELQLYDPVFHLNALWLVAVGVAVLGLG
ncbi:MAG TPA: hypothetical protein VEK15_05750 [Vicinamibacteria bacterium]|nr:hypothetical protein [Vicinamibacteria bacterium]